MNRTPIVDFEFGPLARYLDSHPGRHAAALRHDQKWVIRVGSALGFGATLAEASASVCNALMAGDADEDPFSREAIERATRATLDTIPERR